MYHLKLLPVHNFSIKKKKQLFPSQFQGDNRLPVDLVVSALLHNVSSMCLHQMTNSMSVYGGRSSPSQEQQQVVVTAASAGANIMAGPAGAGISGISELGGCLSSSLDLLHLTRVTDILARAVAEKDTQAVICCLVVLEVNILCIHIHNCIFI